jgi:hypothetical protein
MGNPRSGKDNIMRNGRSRILLASLLVGGFLMVALCLTAQPADKKTSLVGTWEHVSSKYGTAKTFSPFSDGKNRLKFITPTHSITMVYDSKTHKIESVHGGRCVLTPDGYTEKIEMATDLENFKSSLGKSNEFKVRFEGDTFVQSWGTDGQKAEEKWRRAPVSDLTTVKSTAAPAAKPVTLKGEAVCAKCILNQTPECQLALRVETGGLSLAYFLEPNDVFKQFEASLADKKLDFCKTPVKVTATGMATQIDGKPIFTATRLEQNP